MIIYIYNARHATRTAGPKSQTHVKDLVILYRVRISPRVCARERRMRYIIMVVNQKLLFYFRSTHYIIYIRLAVSRVGLRATC